VPEQDESEPDDGFETEAETRSRTGADREEERTERDLEERQGFPTERET